MAFHLGDARICALLSRHAYSFDVAGLGELGRVEFVPVTDNGDPATSFAGVYIFPDFTAIAYRGTMKSVPDWVRNFQTRLVATELGGRVHEGFYGELFSVQAQVDDVLRAREASRRPILLTGHSQGGAVAVLATRYLERKGFLIGGTYTFAAPRPGNDEFRDVVTSTVCRVEFGNDIIPHIPPPRIIGELMSGWAMWLAAKVAHPLVKDLARLAQEAVGYVSVGRLTYLRASGKHEVDLDEDAERRLVPERLWGLVRGTDLVKAHAMENYVRALHQA